MISVDDALARIFAGIGPAQGETIGLAEANGRVLAAPLVAAHNQPPFDASAMDGYAVRAADLAHGPSLRLVGTSQAGQRFVGKMDQGQCVRIFTGAPLPIGADTVAIQENARVNGTLVTIEGRPTHGENVRTKGHDFRQGSELLPVGTRMAPAKLGLAAAANRASLTVARRPALAVLATGDELVPPGHQLGSDQIVASNSFGLIPLLGPHASHVTDLGIAPDEPEMLDAALLRALDAGVDVIVTTGGASVGERDYMREVLANLGVTLDFWKLAMRPGKPLMFGTRGKTLIFGLPGNPVSSLVTAMVVVLPALRRMAGDTAPLGPRLTLPLAAPLPANGTRRHYVRAQFALVDGASAIAPIGETSSGHSSSLAAADALIIQPEHDGGRPVGALVEIMPS